MADIQNTKDEKMLIELNIEKDHFSFASSIETALLSAKQEYQQIDTQLSESLKTLKKLTPECDKIDFTLSASCGALCSVLDIFLVGKPKKSPIGNITDKWFEDRTKDFAKMCGWEDNGKGLSSAINHLEKTFKVPYDQRGAGDAGSIVYDLNPKNHHFKSLAHNPTLLGLFFSILDQFSTPNQSHFVTGGELIALQDADNTFKLQGNDVPSKLFCAIVNWFGHLISDISGSNGSTGRGMGIPSPFWAWTNDIIAIKRSLNISVTEFDKSINELALNIYKEGYDIRFQAAQAIPVFVNEILVRLIYSVRRMMKYFVNVRKESYSFNLLWKECEPFSNATVNRMLTVAHGTFCLIDLSDAAVRGIATGGNITEFVMHLNIVGVGKFGFSLYGEIDCKFKRNQQLKNVYFLKREKVIIEDYIEGLKCLSNVYNDRNLLTFVDDLKNSSTYKSAFNKSTVLAKIRNVPPDEILETKKDIDSHFNGGNSSCSKKNPSFNLLKKRH